MSTAEQRPPLHPRLEALVLQTRFVRVIAAMEFKLKYAGSALGYLWSLIKPLAIFTVLYLVFGRVFKLGATFHDYPLYLLIGIVLWTFFADAVTVTMPSIVNRGSLLRKLSFPRIVIPVSATVTATITFAINLVAIGVFIAAAGIAPRANWLLMLPLLVELYLFTLAFGLVLATLFVRFRDIGQIWELLAQLLFYATPIIYPVWLLPGWARSLALLNPFAQLMQDIRALVIYRAPGRTVMTASDVLGGAPGRIYPLAIVLLLCAGAVLLFRSEEPLFAERV